MKKLLSTAFVVLAIAGLSSCSSLYHTSSTLPIETSIVSASTADLQVAQKKISFTYNPTGAVRKCGEKRVIETAVAQALQANGNADVLVGMQYEIKKSKNIFGKTSIKYVTVTGYPATYVNVKPKK